MSTIYVENVQICISVYLIRLAEIYIHTYEYIYVLWKKGAGERERPPTHKSRSVETYILKTAEVEKQESDGEDGKT